LDLFSGRVPILFSVNTMGGNSDTDEFDDEDVIDEETGEEELDLDRAMREIDTAKRRASRNGNGGGEPAWRRLEQRAEQKHTAELISDFEDYDIDEPGKPARPGRPGRRSD
jgi:hypothetical protein